MISWKRAFFVAMLASSIAGPAYARNDAWYQPGRVEPTPDDVVDGMRFRAEAYVGFSDPDEFKYDTGSIFDLKSGATLGGAISASLGVLPPGVTVQLDVLATDHAFLLFPDDSIWTASVMLDTKYTLPLTPSIDAYGGLGAGAMMVGEDYIGGGTGVGLGYQLIGGLSVQVADTPLRLFGEVRYQGTLGQVTLSNHDMVSTGGALALVGLDLPIGSASK